MVEQSEKREIKIALPEHLKAGAYSNNTVVSHTREEFILDFMMIAPSTGTVTARVILSPGHMKRIIAAMQENLKRYEEKFGKVTAAEEPNKGKLGFQPH